MSISRLLRTIVLVFCTLIPCYHQASAYSLLTHEELIDLTWKDSIVPLLLSRYPTLTPEQLEHARAYAYGGCVIQDIGYYPYGDRTFSDLTHYVRSGDFVVNLFRNAGNADELAFAVGALSHYIGDSVGHSLATNLAVPIEFPKLAAKFGSSVSYADGKRQHVQTEFAFDINEVVHHRVAPVQYLRHIGLEVPQRQLALAYYQTYGLTEDFTHTRGRRVNVKGYRFAVYSFIPRIAYALAILHRHDEPAEPNTPEARELANESLRVASENKWSAYQRKNGVGTYALAGLIFVLPKVGPLKLVAIKGPNEATEADYLHSVSVSTATLRKMLARFTPPPATGPGAAKAAASDTHSDPPPSRPLMAKADSSQVIPRQSRDARHPLPNRDLDTGFIVKPGRYALTDATYANLLHQLTHQPDQAIPPAIKEDLRAFYANPNRPIVTKKDREQWEMVQADLVKLDKMSTSTEPMPYPTYGEDIEEAQQNGQ